VDHRKESGVFENGWTYSLKTGIYDTDFLQKYSADGSLDLSGERHDQKTKRRRISDRSLLEYGAPAAPGKVPVNDPARNSTCGEEY
jgi:hypothetical protein